MTGFPIFSLSVFQFLLEMIYLAEPGFPKSLNLKSPGHRRFRVRAHAGDNHALVANGSLVGGVEKIVHVEAVAQRARS